MELRDKIRICMMCENCKRDYRGVVCGLTDDKPTFETECENFAENPVEAAKVENVTYYRKDSNTPPAIKGTALFLVIAIINCASFASWILFGLLALTVDETLLTEVIIVLSGCALNAITYFYIWHQVRRQRSFIAYISGTLSYTIVSLSTIPALFVMDASVDMLSFNFGIIMSFIASIFFSVIMIITLFSERMFKDVGRPTKPEIVTIVLGGVVILFQIIALLVQL